MTKSVNGKKEVEYDINDNGCHICISHAKGRDGHCIFNREGRTQYIHRFVFEKTYGEIPDGMIVRHKCDAPSCINPEHMELGTHADNVRDRVERNRSATGTDNGRAKLDEEKVRYVRNSDKSSWELSKFFEVDPKVIRDIRQNKTWKHVV